MVKERICLALFLVGCGAEAEPPPQVGPTYHQDVAPILSAHCVGCHREGAIAGFLPLDSYERSVASIERIMDEVRSRRMPPSVVDVSGQCQSFVDSRMLDPDQIAMILEWGSTSDRPRGASAVSTPPESAHLERVDQTIGLEAPYRPSDESADDYRCFVIDPRVAEDTFLGGYEVRPGDATIVHHAILFSLASSEADDEARAFEAEDDRPGYACFGGPRVGDFRFLAGWAPGTGPTRFPEGTGIPIPAGRKMVLQIHYNLLEGSGLDQTEIDLLLEASVPNDAIVLPLANLDLALAPGQRDVDSTIEVELDADDQYRILGAFPHMHRLGRSLIVERQSAGATEPECLLDVPRWNFEWQEFFFYQDEIRLGPGDRVRLTCSYDTTSRNEPVAWGEGTDDEMCLVGFYLTK